MLAKTTIIGLFDLSSLWTTIPQNSRPEFTTRRQVSPSMNLPTFESPIPPLLVRQVKRITASWLKSTHLLGQHSPNVSGFICLEQCTFAHEASHSAVVCRVCNLPVKKKAVLCEQCSLIAHSKCAHDAPLTCDLRAQLLLSARYGRNSSQLEPRVQTTLRPSNEIVSEPNTSFDFGQPSTSSSANPPVHVPRDANVLPTFKRLQLPPKPAAQLASTVDPIPASRERHTSPPPQNPPKWKGKGVAKLAPSNTTSPISSNPRGRDGLDGSTNNTRRIAGARNENIVSGDNRAGVARLSRISRYSAIPVESDGYSTVSVESDRDSTISAELVRGQETISPTNRPGGPLSSPTTSKKRTQKDACLVQ